MCTNELASSIRRFDFRDMSLKEDERKKSNLGGSFNLLVVYVSGLLVSPDYVVVNNPSL